MYRIQYNTTNKNYSPKLVILKSPKLMVQLVVESSSFSSFIRTVFVSSRESTVESSRTLRLVPLVEESLDRVGYIVEA